MVSGLMFLVILNMMMDGVGFYVSYNDYDMVFYGCEIIVFVLGQMECFYIFKGDYCCQYVECLVLGFEVCLDYYCVNFVDVYFFSDKIF